MGCAVLCEFRAVARKAMLQRWPALRHLFNKELRDQIRCQQGAQVNARNSRVLTSLITETENIN
jgi:hypothetical protein